MSTASKLPTVLLIEGRGDRSLSVARVLKQAIHLIDAGTFEGVDDQDIEVINGNLRLLLDAVKD
jgi:hypothetical protein